MRRSSFLMLIVAGVLGVIAVFIAKVMISPSAPSTAASPAMIGTVAANVALSFGDKITNENVKLVRLPAGAVPAGAFRNISDAVGDGKRVAQRAIAANEVIVPVAISGSGSRLSTMGVIGPAMRAMSVTLSESTGVAGLLAPGDHVDVYITRTPPDKAPRYDVTVAQQATPPGAAAVGSSAATALQAAAVGIDGQMVAHAGPHASTPPATLVRAAGTPEGVKSTPITDLLIQDVRVLAIGQDTNTSTEKPSLTKSATLEVTPQQVAKLTLGQSVGTLTLALRPLSDKDRAAVASLHVDDLHDGAAVRPVVVSAPRRARAVHHEAPPSVQIVRAGATTSYAVPGQ